MNDKQPMISDDALKQLLQDKAHESGDNPWFTRRVLNRLPARRPMLWMGLAAYVVAGLLLVGAWVWMLHDASTTTAYTVRDVLQYAAVVAVTVLCIKEAPRRYALF